MQKSNKILAPGKLILSGEHSVVYGHPAIAMAVNRYVVATASTDAAAPHISFDLSDLSYQKRISMTTLNTFKKRIKQNYQRFVSGDFKIRDVLQKPVELAQIAFSLFFEALNIKLTQGIKIHVSSDIPMGCGMGSSAATVLSIVHAIANHLKMDLTPEMFLRLGLEAENMQHGYSSGLDLRVSLYGGCLYMKAGQIYPRSLPDLPMFLVNTGSPESTTGECVENAASFFKGSEIGNDFAAVTDAMDHSLSTSNIVATRQAIKQNHRLLVNIQVVPEAVQHFISDVEVMGGGAKICGAGSIKGKSAGVVLIVTEDEAHLAALCERHQYTLLPIACEARGVHVS